ncbi:MAG: 4-demethylwyosine synthase TYW1, partial [Candidatus Diapherotrites archaeon]|nr:4-demethylwyosine synthase TYW1 [Candidatus Diapherotrites archaeon]
EEIIDGSIEAQKKLLEGFYGNPKADKKKLEEAQYPNQVAISLTGEPTLYPKIGELIKAFKKRNFSTFLVTNAAHPEVLEKMELPTQLYMSLDAPNREIHKKLNLPLNENVWDSILGTINLFPKLNTRKVVRVTAVKEYNMVEPENYAELIKQSGTDFVEVKSYMAVGHSTERLGHKFMPTHEETRKFAEEINKHLGYELTDESIPSRVVLLWNGKTPKIIPGIDD